MANSEEKKVQDKARKQRAARRRTRKDCFENLVRFENRVRDTLFTSFTKLTSEEMEVEVSSSCTGLFNQATSDTTDLLADNMVEVVLL